MDTVYYRTMPTNTEDANNILMKATQGNSPRKNFVSCPEKVPSVVLGFWVTRSIPFCDSSHAPT